jgi:hypothetical protein
MNKPRENFDNDSGAENDPITDDRLIKGVDFYLEHVYGGNSISCFVDFILTGSGITSVIDFTKALLPDDMREKLGEIEQMEEYSRRRELVMDHLRKKVIKWLCDQLGTTNVMDAINSMTIFDSKCNATTMQAFLLIQKENLPATKKLYVSEIGPLSKEADDDKDAPPIEPEEMRELMIMLLTEIVRKHLERAVLSEG